MIIKTATMQPLTMFRAIAAPPQHQRPARPKGKDAGGAFSKYQGRGWRSFRRLRQRPFSFRHPRSKTALPCRLARSTSQLCFLVQYETLRRAAGPVACSTGTILAASLGRRASPGSHGSRMCQWSRIACFTARAPLFWTRSATTAHLLMQSQLRGWIPLLKNSKCGRRRRRPLQSSGMPRLAQVRAL